MRIAVVAPYDFSKIGGVENFVLSTCKVFAREHEVSLVTHSKFNLENVKVQTMSEVDQTQFDLCLSHAIFGGGEIPEANVYIHTFHGTILGNLKVRPWLWLHPRFWMWLGMEMASLKDKTGVIGVSDWACSEIRRMKWEGELRQIPSGGGFEESRYEMSQVERTIDEEALICVFCGRKDDKVKRFDWIARGIELARKKCPGVRLKVIGGEKQPDDNGIEFLGNIPADKVGDLLSNCHVQINASHYEGYSLSISEGIFKAGLITLCTRVGGNLHQLEHGKTGFFFESPEELAAYLVTLAKNHELRKDMFKNILESELIWSWEEVCEEILEFHSELTGEASDDLEDEMESGS